MEKRILCSARVMTLIVGLGTSMLFSSLVYSAPTTVVGSGAGQQGETVIIPIEFDDGDIDLAAFNITITISDPSQFADFVPMAFNGDEAVSCPAFVPVSNGLMQISCAIPTGIDNEVRYLVEHLSNLPLPSEIDFGRLALEVASDADIGEVVALTLTTESYADPDANTIPPGDSTSGSVEIIDAPPSNLDVNPASIDFGEVFVGALSAEGSISVCNSGEVGSIELLVSDILIDVPQFTLTTGGDCPSLPFTLSQGECCTQNLVFAPDQDQLFPGTLLVQSDAGIVSSDTVALLGAGVAPPVELVFVQSPDYGVAGGPLYGGIEVHVFDTNGDLFTADSSTVVEMSIVTDPSGLAILSGQTQVTVSNGIAVFDDLSIDQVGTGFVLRASDQSGDLDSGDSDAFAVLPLDLLQDRFQALD